MFTHSQLHTIHDALILAQKSNNRAMNTAKNPEFKTLYEKINTDILETLTQINKEIEKTKTATLKK